MGMHFSISGLGGPQGDHEERPDEEPPFRVLVIADFGGRGSRGELRPLGGRRPRLADIDTFEPLMAAFDARATIRLACDSPIEITVRELDDLHPDALYERVELFAHLRTIRRRLQDPATFEQAAAELRPQPEAPAGPGDGKANGGTDAGDVQSTEPPASDFEALLAGRRTGSPIGSEAGDAPPAPGLETLLRAVVGPHIVPAPHPDRDALVGSVDRAIGSLMRSILRDPSFRDLEAAWRGLHALVTGLETGESLEIYALDATIDEIRLDLENTGTTGSMLRESLVTRPRETEGGVPWGLVCLDHRFGPAQTDAALLERLAPVLAEAGAPLIAGAHEALLGCPDIARAPDPSDWTVAPPDEARLAWDRLRGSTHAGAVGLALPRVMGRLAYGPGSDPIEAFAFDEVEPGESPGHACLWVNGAFTAVLAIARTAEDGAPALRGAAEVGDLPILLVDAGGERELHPCAEAYLSDRAAHIIADAGFIPILSVQGRNAVRVAGLRSIRAGDGRLDAAWAG